MELWTQWNEHNLEDKLDIQKSVFPTTLLEIAHMAPIVATVDTVSIEQTS